MALNNTGSNSGNWVKERDIASYSAILVEPKRYSADVPKGGKYPGKQNILEADLTLFDKAALEGGKPKFLKAALLTGAGTTREYGDKIGEQFVARLILKPSKHGNDFYSPVGVDDAVFDKVAAYLDQREKAIQEAVDGDDPDWMSE